MRFSSSAIAFASCLFALVACSGSSSSDVTGAARSDDAGVSSPDASGGGVAVGAFEAESFTVGTGSFSFLDMSACCSSTCAGNNPTSPYGAIFLPRAPGQTDASPNERADGMADSYRLRADEAIVLVGPKPPEASYYGFTPYVVDRAKPDGSRRHVAASVSETLNKAEMKIAGDRIAFVAAADATTLAAAKRSLVASGIPEGAINVMVFDPALVHFGLDAAADTLGVLFRLALPKDASARDAYLANPGATVLRLTPKTPAAASPLPSPSARVKDTTHTEAALTSAVDQLGAAILAANPTFTAQPMEVDDGVPNPSACLDGTAVCAFDNRDTTYPGTSPRVLFASDDDFYVAYGVDHQVSGKVTYANVSVYAMEKLVGILGVASDKYPGSAQKYVPQSPDAPKLYAWKFARKCNGEPFCTEVPKGGCPTGIDNGKLGTLTFRTYLEPTTHTAPSPATLVRDRVVRFRK